MLPARGTVHEVPLSSWGDSINYFSIVLLVPLADSNVGKRSGHRSRLNVPAKHAMRVEGTQMEYRGRTPNKAIARAKLDEGKRQLDKMRTSDISAQQIGPEPREDRLRSLDEQYEILKNRADEPFSASDDKVAALASDIDRALDEWIDSVKQMWDDLKGDRDDEDDERS